MNSDGKLKEKIEAVVPLKASMEYLWCGCLLGVYVGESWPFKGLGFYPKKNW